MCIFVSGHIHLEIIRDITICHFLYKSFTDASVRQSRRVNEQSSQRIQNLETQMKRLTNCPRGWNKHGKSCYMLNTRNLTWTAADKFCRNLSAKLAEIGMKSENDFIENILKNNSDTERAWLGGIRAANGVSWIWSFSEIPLSYKNWGKGEPNNAKGTEDCLEIEGTRNRRWNDTPCTFSAASLCEKEL
ncbi:galactose-specific lectin nattectin-like isoform X2 [Ostrea edulis]|uniref:galactose-specific lectin nattectin-like isoform X2 n=1 Tax=Ostrea edulis TaxID=37623 RepID=UPI0024AEA58C|nr:galactose-specific lectin nattectin-like isoform X2 [Ostrea edulis]